MLIGKNSMLFCLLLKNRQNQKTKKKKKKKEKQQQENKKKENKRTCFFGYGIILCIVYFKSVNHSMLQININSFMFFRSNLTMLLLYSVTISA